MATRSYLILTSGRLFHSYVIMYLPLISKIQPCLTVKQCDKIAVSFAAASPDQAKYDYATSVAYTCFINYNHTAGDLTRTCDDTPAWDGSLPTCTIAACLPPPTTTMGTFAPTETIYQFGTNATYTCTVGYYISAGDDTLDCQNDGTWLGTAPTCSSCIQEDSTYMTSIPDQVLHNFGGIIDYTCNLGYNHSSGDVNRTCLPSGLWSGVLPDCVIITCLVPDAPSYSSISSVATEVNYNTSITYTCDLGYNRTSGDATRRCTELATFEGTESTCTITYACDKGYWLLSGDLAHTCNEFADWTDVTPVCTIVTCLKPTESYITFSPNTATYDFNTTVTGTCVIGYNHTDGDKTRTFITCLVPDAPSYSSISSVATEVNYNTSITYTCDLGYNRTNGDATRRCTELATFEGTESTCTITYACDNGYWLLSGDLTHTCNEFADWTDVTPVCTIVTCPKPTESYITFSPNTATYDFNTTVTGTCVIGYNHTDGDKTRTFL
ncbi:CSMD1-like protein [Mya arenaria]|uniref:CSMD1-like protein n=1 Tax=Mya arenaria TaxID=6604 RepID=A0ABY7DEW6_MYAAR|nr:CSMD1-like protein [Mya arenaria]